MQIEATYLSEADTFTKIISLYTKISNMGEDEYDDSIFDDTETLILSSYGMLVVAEEYPSAYESMSDYYGVDDVETLAGLLVKLATDGDEAALDILPNLVMEGANYFAALEASELPGIPTFH